ncbi:hypothetical protein DIPPA_70212 [Diplonema papillatum]|nr:hypothetical protein DIPPA_70212 [Diplonema papillatum]
MKLLGAIMALHCSAAVGSPVPVLPKQFSANVQVNVTTRECMSEKWPACERSARLSLDAVVGKVRITWLRDFENINRTYIRRHDIGREYELKEICFGENRTCDKVCSRSALHHPVLQPQVLEGATRILGDACVLSSAEEVADTWRFRDLVVQSVLMKGSEAPVVVSVSTPTVSWTLSNVTLLPPPDSDFVVPYSFSPQQSCRHAPDQIGFPYIHLFGHLLTI